MRWREEPPGDPAERLRAAWGEGGMAAAVVDAAAGMSGTGLMPSGAGGINPAPAGLWAHDVGDRAGQRHQW